MKVIDVALKDLYRSFRSAFFLVFAFALPLLTAALFYFAFGGLASGDGGFDLPTTQVQVANLDQGQFGFSFGELVATVLKEAIPDLIQVTEVSDATGARSAVDGQQAAVAVIIPVDFTQAVFAPDGRAAVELYQDPTLTLGPGIVKGVVSRLVDGFAGSKIATTVAIKQIEAQGLAVDEALPQEIAMQYAGWSTRLGEEQQAGQSPLLDIQPVSASEESSGMVTDILGPVMAGMLVFYVFFSGAASAQSILQEDELGTLPRLFTTPTPQSSILGGKFLATFVILTIQVVVLLAASSLIFGLDWGDPLSAVLVTVGLVVLASSFGIFITSFLKDSRQGGIVYGGLLTVLGMLGMVGVFTTSVPGASSPMSTASLFVPHGWAVRGMQQLLAGAGVGDVLLTVGVMLAAGLVFFVAGVYKFSRRFA